MRRDETDQFCHGLLSFGLSLDVDTEGGQVSREIGIKLRVVADVAVNIWSEDQSGSHSRVELSGVPALPSGVMVPSLTLTGCFVSS